MPGAWREDGEVNRMALPLGRRTRLIAAPLGALAAFVATLGAFAAEAPLARVQPAIFGEFFPGSGFTNLNPGAGGPPKVDLSAVVGKKPVVLYYWMAGNTRSEQVFLELQKLADEIGPSRLALFGVATPPLGSYDVAPIRARIQALKLHLPVLYDEEFRLGQRLDVGTVPNVSILDAEGRLRLSNGGSLRQTLEYKLDLEGAIRRLATTGQLGTYGQLPTYYPATELVGQRTPDFEAAAVEDGAPRKLSSLLATDRVNVLIFWSVDCPHCRERLPQINQWYREHREGMNLISCAKVMNDAMRTKTEEFCRANGFVFPTLADPDMKIAQLYQVVSTPTMFIIRPGGVVDSVLLTGESDYVKTFEVKKRQLLKPQGSS